MCIVYLGQNLSDDIKLLVASNRDEFYSRPYSHIHEWENGVIAGRDEKERGTWLGFNKEGQFAFITNFRTGKKRENIRLSRGEIVSKYLSHGELPEIDNLSAYGDFNFIYGSLKELSFLSNIEGNSINASQSFSISNGLGTKKWPKMLSIEKKVFSIDLKQGINEIKNEAFDILSDSTKAQDDLLPDTGVGLEYERILSSIFIESPTYGTVTQNVSIVDKHNILYMYERDVREKSEKLIKVQLEPR